jgi:hypothetical protein
MMHAHHAPRGRKLHVEVNKNVPEMSLDKPHMRLEERENLLEKKPNEPQKWPISRENGPQMMSWGASQVTQKT